MNIFFSPFKLLSIRIIEKTEVPMVRISTYGMYKYLWYVDVPKVLKIPKVCISTYGM